MADVKFLLTGDTSLSVEFGNEISTEINAKIRAFNIALENSKIPGIVETVPTYRSLMVHYDPSVIRYEPLVKRMKGLLGSAGQDPDSPQRRAGDSRALRRRGRS